MKKIGMNSKIRKVAVAAILVAVLIGFSMAMIAPVVEASDVPTLDSQLAGSFNFGTAGISDPVRIETGEGYYMHPYSYVYLGEVYNSVTKSYDVVICRVLDADSDILGNPGAMLLYTESAIDPTYFYRYSTEYTDLIGTENIYASSTLARLEANGKYSLRSHYGRHFDNVPEPEDFLRPVTKTDVKANMSGLYTDFLAGIDHSKYPSLVPDFDYIFSFETDTVKEDSGPYYVAEKSDSTEALNNATFFPLSAEEFNKYMGSLSSSKNYVSKYTLTGDGVSYWLRTGIYEQVDLPSGNYDNWESQFAGNLVLGVDPDGNLTAIPAEKEGIYGRFAFNFETESISYTRKIDGVHKLAFADSRYAEGDLFEAEIVNTENGIVTLKYTNAIRSRSTVWYGEDEVEYVSVIIKDEYGNVKSYASIAEVPQCYYAEDEEKKSSESYTAEFLLPEDYDEENDTILVFWERKSSDERKPSFTSNMVELDCAHTYYNEDGSYDKLPTCTAQGSCAICGDDFGEFDPENHPNMENGEYKYDDAENKHWNICPDCGADGEYEDCTFINYCIAPCVCGNIDENSIHHDYGDNGVCRRDQSHYEKPEMTVYGYYNIVVRIKNEGNWLWLANQIAEGKKQYVIWETYSVYLDDDLDFKYLDFVPLGTQENPFVGELDSLGRNYTISNISYSDTDRDGVGIIGVGKNVKIKNINVENVTFEGKDYVGALVGAATNVDVEGITVKGNVDINAMGDKVGAFFGSCDMDSSIRLSFSYTTLGGVLNYLPGTGEGTPTIDTSFFLSEEDGDGGSLSEEGFASGAVAYSFNQTVPGLGWRQTVVGDETDAYPKRRGDTNYENSSYVRITEYCDGTPAKYTNNKKDEMIHNPAEFHGFVWDSSYNYCDADVLCDKCNQRMMTPADVQIIYEYPKATYIASIMVGGELMESDPVVIFGVSIEEFIGMTEMTVIYKGTQITSDLLMTNHALHESEYVAYFVNSETGEKYMYEGYYGDIYEIGITDVGVYDLVVVGRQGSPWTQVGGNWTEDNTVDRVARDFSGQSVTYERVLTVLPAEVTVTPYNVYKYKDGEKSFIPNWSIDNESFLAWEFDVVFSDAPSAEVGDYTLSVTADTGYHGDNVILTLSKDSVIGSIIENRKVEISNKDYPDVFSYGDEIPTPTASNFNMTAGSEFSYEWFEDRTSFDSKEPYIVPMEGTPKNAGSYVLRAYASSDGTLGGSYVDVEVVILKKTVEVDYEFDSGVTIVEYYYDNYYLIDSLDQITVKLSGFIGGESADSLGITVKAAINDVANLSPIKIDPSRINTYLTFTVDGDASNYEFVEAEDADYIVSLPGVGLPEIIKEEYSYEYNYGDEIWGFRYKFSWQTPDVVITDEDFNHWVYIITIYDISNGIENKVETGISGVQVGRYDRTDENSYTVRTNKAGEYLIAFEIRAENYLRNEVEIPGTEDNRLYMEYYVRIGIRERADGDVDEILHTGCYTVTVNGYETFENYDNGEADKTTSHEFFLTKEITMNLKEIEYNISDGSFNFDMEDLYKHVIMEAGGVFSLGHELVDADIYVDVYRGYASVTGFRVVDSLGNDVSYLYSVKRTNHNGSNHDGGIGTAHIFDSPCDADCNVRDCEYTRVVSHAGDTSGEGNCNKAYICENCGAPYMPENPTHLSDKTVIVRCGDDLSLHEIVYVCCGTTSHREEHYSADGATCKTLASCDGCTRSFGELDPDNHEEEAEYTRLDENMHTVSYSCCSASFDEEHRGGEATCENLAVCSDCDAGYGELDPDNHVGELEANADPNNPNMHTKVYDCCEKTYYEPHSGGTATCLAPAVCSDCGVSYGELDPDNHTSDSVTSTVRSDNASMHDSYHSCCNEYIGKFYHTGGVAYCNGGAACDECGERYGDADLTHHASDEYRFVPDENDPTVHVKLSACCGVEIERIEHSFGEANCINGATCSECGASDGNITEHKYENACAATCTVCDKTTRSEVFHVDEDGDEACDHCGTAVERDGISGGGISAIITGSTVAAGAGGFSLFWFVIKKKSLLELLAFFK